MSDRQLKRGRQLNFSVDTPDAFGAYHDLYDSGTTVSRLGDRFRAKVVAHRFPNLLIFDRQVAGAVHHRDEVRVRRNSFDHINLQVLRSGAMAAGVPGQEAPMRPGDVVVFDTAKPQRTVVSRADYVSLALARDTIEAVLPHVSRLHGSVIPADAAGMLGDFLLAMGKHAATLSPTLAQESAATAGHFLAAATAAMASKVGMDISAPDALDLQRWRAEAYIEDHLADQGLSVDAIAPAVGLSRAALYAAFAPVKGVTHHIVRRRLARLRQALLRPDEARSIGSLAAAFGFASESHCNRAFKVAFGLPPGQFRIESRMPSGASPDLPVDHGWADWWNEVSERATPLP